MDQPPLVATSRRPRRLRCWHCALFIATALLTSGCLRGRQSSLQSSSSARPSEAVPGRGIRHFAARTISVELVSQSQADLAEAEELDRQEREECVDAYYRAALNSALALPAAEMIPAAEGQSAWDTYHRALRGLIDAGQHYGRLDPRQRLTVHYHGTRQVPISYHGFAWQAADFSVLASADQFKSSEIAHRYVEPGLGMSLVAVRVSNSSDEMFFRPWQPFAATAVLRPTAEGDSVLELYNPNSIDTVAWNGSQVGLARDLTAPLAAIVSEAPRQYLRGFTAPSDTSVKPKLILMEPYQRGKIPVVFIHGLYSDPITWADTVNELRSQGDIYRDYQFWVFRYPTGGELLESITELREKLQLARAAFAPRHDDPALDAMVLVGHSLGGLVAKMQVVSSQDTLWREVARQPFDYLRATPEVRLRLSRYFFFEPLPFVTRVVFVGTPHHGSEMTRRLAGRVGDKLVRFGSEADAEYRDLMGANEDVFKPVVARRRPTSIDLLEPTSPFLAALERTPVNPDVRLHSIIGTGGVAVLKEPGDGVVAVSSARHPGVESELYVPEKHEKLHRHPESITELERILREHAGELKLPTAGGP